ncbi:UNVERIFIED_CONTAM: putative sucrose-phosphate synthase [Sesamum radiatum]|uniref:Sucrose-phosphate synthase n=1 Tax=Sesamum radiatum TaxID=300843 RepID=A0AAW2NPF5_SESRA
MSEDLSEGEKGDVVGDLSAHGESNKGRLPRISSVDTMEAWASQQKGKKLYIVLISLHGLIRGEHGAWPDSAPVSLFGSELAA